MRKRTGSDKWQLKKTFRPKSQSQQNKGKWTGYGRQSNRIVLDGEVKIEVSQNHSKRYGPLGFRRVRLSFVDVLPALKESAIALCKIGVTSALKLTVGVSLGVAAVAVAAYAIPVKLTAASTALSEGGVSALARHLGWNKVRSELKSKTIGSSVYWIQRAVGVSDPITVDDLLGATKQWLREIFNYAEESYQRDCRFFKRQFLSIARGYGAYADELAKVYGRTR